MIKIYYMKFSRNSKNIIKTVCLCTIPNMQHCKRAKNKEIDSPKCSQLIFYNDTVHIYCKATVFKKIVLENLDIKMPNNKVTNFK